MMTTDPTAMIKVSNIKGRQMVLDIVRNRYVALTPEEWVRQQVIHYLHFSLDYPLELMQVEGAITLNGMTRRCDIVVYDRQTHPWMIVECKQESVPITQKVLDQACRYNIVLHVPYLFITNGPQQLFCHVNFENKTLEMMENAPKYVKVC